MRTVMAGGVAVAVVALVGCHTPQQQQADARAEAIASWRNVPLITLERHPLFSYRTPVVRTLSDGTETWTYSSCRTEVESRGGAAVVGNDVFARSRTTAYDACCVSQFFIGAGPGAQKQVLEYRPTGCATTCEAGAFGCGQSR